MADLEQEFEARYSQGHVMPSTLKLGRADPDVAALIRSLAGSVQSLQKDLVKDAHEMNNLRAAVLALEDDR